jgi:hypothetical protein
MIKYQAPFRLINNAASSAKLYLELNLMKEKLRLGILYQRHPAPYHQSWHFNPVISASICSAAHLLLHLKSSKNKHIRATHEQKNQKKVRHCEGGV